MSEEKPGFNDEYSTEEDSHSESNQGRRRPIELKKRRKSTRHALRYPPLSEEMILEWADQHHSSTGKWPSVVSGMVMGGVGTWIGVDAALSRGHRTLPGGSSLATLLEQRRGRRNRANLPPLTEEQILEWADEHHSHTGEWPSSNSGDVIGATEEKWRDLSQALNKGSRTLPGGSSLAKLLSLHRDRRHLMNLPPLSEDRIVEWADAHRALTGDWPTRDSGPIIGGEGDTWCSVTAALQRGIRSLTIGSSLTKLLEKRRGRSTKSNLPKLTPELILTWADAHRERTGHWPTQNSGAIPYLSEETWGRVDTSLNMGIRGLQKGSSLARLLWEHRGVRYHLALPILTEGTILEWADSFFTRYGRWPTLYDGVLDEDAEETWAKLDTALRAGSRNLPAGSSLSRLLAERRDVRNRMHPPNLTVEQILEWSNAYYRRNHVWPTESSEPIPETRGETWISVAFALRMGHRGLTAGSSLAKLIDEVREGPRRQYRGILTVEEILSWADAHHADTGRWPTTKCGAVTEARYITWCTVHKALVYGYHGLSGGDSLAALLRREREGGKLLAARVLSEDEILKWAQGHYQKTGKWPSAKSGALREAPAETWWAIDRALFVGRRGLSGSSSLAQLLNRIRGARSR